MPGFYQNCRPKETCGRVAIGSKVKTRFYRYRGYNSYSPCSLKAKNSLKTGQELIQVLPFLIYLPGLGEQKCFLYQVSHPTTFNSSPASKGRLHPDGHDASRNFCHVRPVIGGGCVGHSITTAGPSSAAVQVDSHHHTCRSVGIRLLARWPHHCE